MIYTLLISYLLFQTSKFLALNAAKCVSNVHIEIEGAIICNADVLETNINSNNEIHYAKIFGPTTFDLERFKNLYFMETGYYGLTNVKTMEELNVVTEFEFELTRSFTSLKGAFIHREQRASSEISSLYSIGNSYFLIDGISDFKQFFYQQIYEIHFYKDNVYNFTNEKILILPEKNYELKVRTDIEQLIMNSLNQSLIENYYPNLICLIINLKSSDTFVTSKFFDQLKSLRFILINSNKNYQQAIDKWIDVVNSLPNLRLLLHYNTDLKFYDLIVIIKSEIIELCNVDINTFNCKIYKGNNLSQDKQVIESYSSLSPEISTKVTDTNTEKEEITTTQKYNDLAQTNLISNTSDENVKLLVTKSGILGKKGVSLSRNSNIGKGTQDVFVRTKINVGDRKFTTERTLKMNNWTRLNFISTTDNTSEKNTKSRIPKSIIDPNEKSNTSRKVTINDTGIDARTFSKLVSDSKMYTCIKDYLLYITIILAIANVILILIVPFLILVNDQQRRVIQKFINTVITSNNF